MVSNDTPYSYDEDPMLCELHEIRHAMAARKDFSPETINRIGREVLNEIGFDPRKIRSEGAAELAHMKQ